MKQIQSTGNDNTNYQAQNMHFNGITYSDAKQIALDVFRNNALELSEIAHTTARERAEELTENFFKELSERAPEAIGSISDPDMQRSIFHAQEEYACSGDGDLGAVLVDMLVDRAAITERNIQQVTLNESIKTAARLTKNHFTILSALLFATKTQFNNVRNLDELYGNYIDFVAPSVAGLRVTDADLWHLQYTGCISMEITDMPMGGMLAQAYPALFSNGFSRDEIAEEQKDLGLPSIIPCLRDPAKFQVGAMNSKVLQSHITSQPGMEGHGSELQRLLNLNLMSAEEIDAEFSEIHPDLKNLTSVWNGSNLRRCQLTGVGIAVGHANARRILGDKFDARLEIWIN
ncbi:LPO_1073/Vpar_1526 family protein [Streptomyces goshikiensis]|uniref:LPO_1073/Vpar_1526 family protein n=1 Tax=Streptomyces goshikiensis TaxID=1942 RepID=UPI003695053C